MCISIVFIIHGFEIYLHRHNYMSIFTKILKTIPNNISYKYINYSNSAHDKYIYNTLYIILNIYILFSLYQGSLNY